MKGTTVETTNRRLANTRGMVDWRLITASLLLFSFMMLPMSGRVTSATAASPTAFSGSASVVKVNALGINQELGATNVYASGSPAFSDERSLLDVELPGSLGSARVGHASTVGQGNMSRSEASLADLNLTVGGNTIGATFLQARARAHCGPGGPSVSGSSEIAQLVINGQTIEVTGAPNQTVDLPLGGKVIINEQSGTSDSINVTALHVIIPGVADVAIANVHADIRCATSDCQGQNAFVTGGGYILLNGTKAHFAVAGRNLDTWGHVLYRDEFGSNVHVKKPYAVVYKSLDALKVDAESKGFMKFFDASFDDSKFEGAAILTWYANDGSIVGEALAIDMGEPGNQPKGSDFFEILSLNTTGSPVSVAGGFLQGGNIQMHGKCL